jgi:type IV pilus assembly protein PilB
MNKKRAQDLAQTYGCEFVDLRQFALSFEHLKVSKELMLRYNFVPLARTPDGRIAIAVGDPSQLMLIDEISSQLGAPVITKVASLTQIRELLKSIDNDLIGIAK